MKKYIIPLTAFLLIALSSHISFAYEFKGRGFGTADVFPDLDFSGLYKLLDEYNDRKISFDDCVIAGIEMLESMENDIASTPIDYSSNRKLKYHQSPQEFMAFIYINYGMLSAKALKKLNSSIWGLGKYLDRKFSTEEIKILTSGGKKSIKWAKGIAYRYDLVDSFQKLIDTGHATTGEVAIYFSLIYRYGDIFKFDFGINYNTEFYYPSNNLLGWISDNLLYIKKNDRHAYRILQLINGLDRTFFSEMYNHKMKLNKANFPTDRFDIKVAPGQSDDYVQSLADVGNAFNNVNNIYEKYLKGIIEQPVCWKRGYADGNKKCEIIIKDLSINGELGNTKPKGLIDEIGHVNPVSITIEIDPINAFDKLFKTSFHEFFHGCQYSYTYESFDNWINQSLEETGFCDDGSAAFIEDVAEKLLNGNTNNSTIIKWSQDYFFQRNDNGNIVGFPDPAKTKISHRYAYSIFFEYLFEKHGLKIIDDVFTSLKNNKSVLTGLETMKFGNLNYLETLHNFNVDNIMLHKTKGVYVIEDKLYTIPGGNVGIDVDIKFLSELPKEISISPGSVTYHVYSGLWNTWERSLAIDFKDVDPNCEAVSAITKWNNGKYSVERLKADAGGNCIFKYITKKITQGMNPEFFIFVFTNVSREIKKIPVANISFSSPDQPLTGDLQKMVAFSIAAGKDYYDTARELYTVNGGWKSKCSDADSELVNLINQYNTQKSDFLLIKIKEKLSRLNITMQIPVMAIHDLRYQFYLRKQLLVEQLYNGATSALIEEQLKRTFSYLSLIENYISKDPILSVIAYDVSMHAMTKLRNTKNPYVFSWNPVETSTAQAIQKSMDNIKNIWKKSNFYYESAEVGNAYTAVGLPEPYEIKDETLNVPGGPPPVPVNFPPNLKKESFALEISPGGKPTSIIYNVSEAIKNFPTVNYKEYIYSKNLRSSQSVIFQHSQTSRIQRRIHAAVSGYRPLFSGTLRHGLF